MKNIFKIIITLLLVVVVSVAAAGCEFIQSKGDGTLADSQILANNVKYNTTTEESSDNDLTLEDAVDKVDRTSVAIYNESGAGSGVIVDMKKSDTESSKYVYILTCYHMVSDKGSVQVILPDENCLYNNNNYTFTGTIGSQIYNTAITLVGGDKDSDIAVLRLDLNKSAVSGNKLSETKIEKAKIQAEYSVRKGQTVFAVGNPSGQLPGTVSVGTIAYIERETSVEEIGSMTLLQISVPSNPGNSGGGLYNLKGELIGITNAGNTKYEQLNYAIPVTLSNGNGFLTIAMQLMGTATDTNYGYVSGRREKFGFVVTEDDSSSPFVYIQSVENNSLAKIAGLMENDKINSVLIDGETKMITTTQSFSDAMANVSIGKSVVLNISRKVTIGWTITIQDISITLTSVQFHFCDTGN